MNDKIQNFISDIDAIDPTKAAIVKQLQALYKELGPSLTTKFIYGGIGYYVGTKLIGGIWVYTNHISIVLGNGYQLSDPEKVLEGGGPTRRHIKIFQPQDIKVKKVEDYLKKYIKIEMEVNDKFKNTTN